MLGFPKTMLETLLILAFSSPLKQKVQSFIHFIFAFINYSTKLHVIIMHLAGSPGSYFAYLKDCLKKRNKKLECKLSMAEQKY